MVFGCMYFFIESLSFRNMYKNIYDGNDRTSGICFKISWGRGKGRDIDAALLGCEPLVR